MTYNENELTKVILFYNHGIPSDFEIVNFETIDEDQAKRTVPGTVVHIDASEDFYQYCSARQGRLEFLGKDVWCLSLGDRRSKKRLRTDNDRPTGSVVNDMGEVFSAASALPDATTSPLHKKTSNISNAKSDVTFQTNDSDDSGWQTVRNQSHRDRHRSADEGRRGGDRAQDDRRRHVSGPAGDRQRTEDRRTDRGDRDDRGEGRNANRPHSKFYKR
jgi:hypothetical protein